MTTPTPANQLPEGVEKRFDDLFLCTPQSAVNSERWIVPHKATVENLKAFIAQELTSAHLQRDTELLEMIGEDEKFDYLDDVEKKYTAQDMECIAVHMRNKLRAELRQKLLKKDL